MLSSPIMDLSGFDPSTMTYLATQMSHPNMGGHDPFQEMLLPMEMREYAGYAGYVMISNAFAIIASTSLTILYVQKR